MPSPNRRSLSRFDSVVIAVCSHVAFLASLVGLAFLFSILTVKHTYSRKLCVKCQVMDCPFNSRRG